MRCLALLFCALLAVAAAAAPNGTARNKTAHIQKAHSSADDDNDNMTAPPAERGDDAGADALVTGVTAFDADSLISDKLARSVNETNVTRCGAAVLGRRPLHRPLADARMPLAQRVLGALHAHVQRELRLRQHHRQRAARRGPAYAGAVRQLLVPPEPPVHRLPAI